MTNAAQSTDIYSMTKYLNQLCIYGKDGVACLILLINLKLKRALM